jgi:EmrB/QacA subfamily drug resistance transporter
LKRPGENPTGKWYVMAAVAVGVFLATVDGSIVNIALPVLQQDLHTDFAVIEWVVLAYLMTITCLMLSIGRMADMIGKKPIYMTGMMVFTIGSGLCGLSPTIALLITARVIQAVGAAMIMALGPAIITEVFPATERGKALGINGLVVSVGIIAGPTLGGLLLGVLSWHWIFFVNLPVGLIGTWMVIRYVPGIHPKGGQRFDVPGALCLFFGLLCLLLSLTFGQKTGFFRWPATGLFTGFVVFLGAFLVMETCVSEPMISLSLFRNTLFSIYLITGFLAFISSTGTILLMPYYLQDVCAYSPQITGLMLAVVPVSVGLIAPWAGSLSDRFGTCPLTAIGLGILVIGYTAVSTLHPDTTTWGYILRFVPVGLGIGFFQSPNNSAIMGSVPRDRLGVASGLLSITRTLGQTCGIAIMGALWAGRVNAHSRAIDAPADAVIQVTALNETLRVIVVLIIIALCLSLWALHQERRSKMEISVKKI